MKYPYIGKGLNSGSIVLFYEQNKGVTLESKTWASENLQHSNCINEDLFTNITRECLENTYGKVESKEHADFLIKLAEKNKIKLGIGGYSERKNYFYFTEDEGLLYLVFASFSPSNKHTSITIPLPPKGEDMKSENVKSEWPQVGDVVKGPKDELLQVRGIDEAHIWCLDTELEYWTYHVSLLKKPPTPEEELREKLKEELSLYISLHDPHDTKIDLTDAILNGEIEGLSYKPE